MKKTTSPDRCPLPELREARIDPALPAAERVRLFVETLGDPYRFQVDGTPVEVLFADGAPSLQACMENLCGQMQ